MVATGIPTQQTEILIAPRGGLNFSLPADLISIVEMSDCQNVFFEAGLVKKRYGYKKFGTNLPLSGPLMGFDQFYMLGGSQFLLAMTTKDIYVWDTTDKEWDLLTEHASADNCDDNPVAWTASENVAVARETTEKKEGTASVKITIDTAFETGLIAYHDKAIGDISAYNHVRFWIKSSITLTAGQLQFLVDDTSACASPLRTIDLPTLAANTWTQVLLDLRDESGKTDDLVSIASIGLKASEDFGECILYIDQIDTYKCFTGTDKDFFSYDYIQKKTEDDLWWICTNNIDAIKKYDGETFENLGGSPPLAKYVIQYKAHLHLLDPTEGGFPKHQDDRWSDTADPENWSTGNAKSTQLIGADWIKGGAIFKGNTLIIFKDRSIWIGVPSFDTNIFDFDPKQTGVGCASGRTIATLGDELIFQGWDDIYVFNGSDYEPISENIRIEFFRRLLSEELDRCFGVVIEETKEYWLFVVPTNAAVAYPNTAWAFNWELNKWTKHKFANYLTAYGYYWLEQKIRWCDLVGRWKDQNWRWGDRRILAQAPTTLFGDKDGNVYEYTTLENNDDGVAIDAYFDTKDFIMRDATGRLIRQRFMGIDVYYIGPSLKVYCSIDRGTTWNLYGTLSASTSLDTPKKLRLRVNGKFLRLRFRNSELNEHFEFSHAEIFREPAGARL